MDASNDTGGPSTVVAVTQNENEKPSCHGCRKRKLKCSREVPTCGHCGRLGVICAYDDRKSKPGLKSGAIESLSRRIETLENAVLKGNGIWDKRGGSELSGINSQIGDNMPGGVLNVLSTLCLELCKHNSSLTHNSSEGRPRTAVTTQGDRSQTVDSHLTTIAAGRQNPLSSSSSSPLHTSDSAQPRKRRRLDSCGNPSIELHLPADGVGEDTGLGSLPSQDLLEEVVSAYFTAVQPWLPILHETRFRTRMRDPDELPSLLVVIHGMIVSAIRFARPESHGLSSQQVEAMVNRSRGIVVLTGMDALAVENLQALIMVAFTDIGNGDASRAWSLVGSLTRTVEYLQLTVEPVRHDTQPLLKPMVSLPPARSWVEEEERRRVFWNIFNLDRFCSVATGWNTSLTADDVHRRLPADGGCWHKGEKVTTPYFGIWDRANAKIGNSLKFLPADYSSPEHPSTEPTHAATPACLLPSFSPAARNAPPPDMSTVGAFAYCIEATESLSRVTTFFLQQRINFHDRPEVSSWLTRFKELDLRLVHWKMFLPRQWKDANISRQPELITMDPNLTLAHVTHNTSMILLHQRVAYPPADWANIVKLPSVWSAETCQNAAIETRNITAKYIKYTTKDSPVTNQFAFCAFVAARVLLVHWRYYTSELPEALWLLVDCLDEMARRWRGPGSAQSSASPDRAQHRCLAETYADHIRDLHRRCVADGNFSVDALGYSTVISRDPFPRQSSTQHTRHEDDTYHQPPDSNGHNSGSALRGLLDHSTSSQDGHYPSTQQVQAAPVQSVEYGTPTNDELSNISYMLLDQRFLDMDRVISLENMIFSTDIDHAPHLIGGLGSMNGGDVYSLHHGV
ncbi:fungal-specific transcription factor domain-containing protein [Coniochaeta sp. 2T2.1]|nr:fungal-specific transcription factor domain-containing protein [Coniochaeta sp. 2T2.1]